MLGQTYWLSMGSMNHESVMFSQYSSKEEIVIMIWPRRRLSGAEKSFLSLTKELLEMIF